MSSIVGRLIRMISPRSLQVEWATTPTPEKKDPKKRQHQIAFAEEEDGDDKVARVLLSSPAAQDDCGEGGSSIVGGNQKEKFGLEREAETGTWYPETALEQETPFCTAAEATVEIEHLENNKKEERKWRQNDTMVHGRGEESALAVEGGESHNSQPAPLIDNVELEDGLSRGADAEGNGQPRRDDYQGIFREDRVGETQKLNVEDSNAEQQNAVEDIIPRRDDEITHNLRTCDEEGVQIDYKAPKGETHKPTNDDSTVGKSNSKEEIEVTPCPPTLSIEEAIMDLQGATDAEIERQKTTVDDGAGERSRQQEGNSPPDILPTPPNADCLERCPSNDEGESVGANGRSEEAKTTCSLDTPMALPIDAPKGTDPTFSFDKASESPGITKIFESQPLSQDIQDLGACSTPVAKHYLLPNEEHVEEEEGGVEEACSSSEEKIMTEQELQETSDLHQIEAVPRTTAESSSCSTKRGANGKADKISNENEDSRNGGDDAHREGENNEENVDVEAATNSSLPPARPLVVDTIGMFFQKTDPRDHQDQEESRNSARDQWRQAALSSTMKFLKRRLAETDGSVAEKDANYTLDWGDMDLDSFDGEDGGIEAQGSQDKDLIDYVDETQPPHTQEDCLSFRTAKQSQDVDSPCQGLESQELEEELHGASIRSRSRCKEGRVAGSKRKMMHVDDTSGHCRSVDALDLSCKSFTLDLCQILSVCDMRNTRRCLRWPSHRQSAAEVRGDEKHNSETCQLPLRLRIPPGGSREDDGPLQCAYKNVVSIEFFELCNENGGGMTFEEAARVRSVAAAAFNQTSKKATSTQRKKRLRAYFYNQYATRMSELLEPWNLSFGETPKKPPLLFSLRNVPAHCIMMRPFSSEDGNVDFDGALLGKQFGRLSSYCLCIGDRFRPPSKVPPHCPILDFSTAPWTDLRFDSAAMEIRALELGTRNVTVKTLDTAEELYLNAKVLKDGWTTESDRNVMTRTYAAIFPVAREGGDDTPMDSETGKAASKKNMQDASNEKEELPAPTEENENQRPKKRARASGRRNTYMKLGDLKDFFRSVGQTKRRMMRGEIAVRRVEDTVNVFGVVLGFSAASPTRGPDLVMKAYLIDENVHEREGESRAQASLSNVPFVGLHIFSKDRGTMPRIAKAGDVVRAHRVIVQEWQGELQLLAKTSSSFLVMRPKNDSAAVDGDIKVLAEEDRWSLITTAKESFSFEQEHLDRAAELWLWGQKRLADFPTMRGDQKMSISQLSQDDMPVCSRHDRQPAENQHGDMTVLLTGIIPMPKEHRNGTMPMGMLRVWDGTGAPISDRLLVASANASGCDPPTEALQAIARVTEDIRQRSCEEDDFLRVSPPKSLCGRVVNVAVWEKGHWETFINESEAKVGQFLRLRNVADGLLNGLSCIMVHSKSALTPLPDNTFEVKKLLLEHHERIVRNDPLNGRSAVLPLDNVTTASVGFESAMAGVKYLMPPQGERNNSLCLEEALGEPAPFTFDARFRVSQTYPDVFLNGSNPDCRALCFQKAGENAEKKTTRFCFALQIYDDSADMDVVVPNNVAEKLFGMSAMSLWTSHEKNLVCRRRLQELRGPDTVCRGRIHSMTMDGFKYFILDMVDLSIPRFQNA